MAKKPNIGSVIVHKDEPDNGNPFRGAVPGTPYPCTSVLGSERADALRRLKHGEDTAGYTFWDLRSASDCEIINGQVQRKITEASRIDWSTSTID